MAASPVLWACTPALQPLGHGYKSKDPNVSRPWPWELARGGHMRRETQAREGTYSAIPNVTYYSTTRSHVRIGAGHRVEPRGSPRNRPSPPTKYVCRLHVSDCHGWTAAPHSDRLPSWIRRLLRLSLPSPGACFARARVARARSARALTPACRPNTRGVWKLSTSHAARPSGR